MRSDWGAVRALWKEGFFYIKLTKVVLALQDDGGVS